NIDENPRAGIWWMVKRKKRSTLLHQEWEQKNTGITAPTTAVIALLIAGPLIGISPLAMVAGVAAAWMSGGFLIGSVFWLTRKALGSFKKVNTAPVEEESDTISLETELLAQFHRALKQGDRREMG